MTSKGTVVVIGSVNWDITVVTDRFPVPGETVLGTSVSYGLGGKGANQAVAAARAGAPTTLLATVGDDLAGPTLSAALDELGVDTALVAVAPGQASGTAHITVDASGQNHIVVVSGANTATAASRVQAASDIIGAAAVVVVQTEIPASAAIAGLELAAALGVRSILNLAPVVTLPDAALALVDVLVVNEGEAAQLLGEPAATTVAGAIDAARALVGRVGAVVLTIGADGAVVVDAAAHHIAAPRPARVVDTTGAGDAVVGVLAAALACGAPLLSAVGDAVAAASRTVEKPGAARSYPAFELTWPGP